MRGERWTPEEARKRLQQWLTMGWTLVGIDEAGRGPLAGPVVAAAILLPPHGTKGTRQRTGLHELARMTTWEWPHAFARFDCPMEVIAKHFSCNHIHAILGDWVGELVAACEYLDIEPIVLS